MYKLLEVLEHEIPRLSNFCCLHIALLGTNLQILHEGCLVKVAHKLVKDIENPSKLRLKDLERLLLALTMFEVEPNTDPDIYEAIFKEIHRDERLNEIVVYPRSLASTLLFLSMKGLYSHELMSRLLDTEFINETFGKSAKTLPREIFVLDKCIEIDCPTYINNRLDKVKSYKAAKWLTEFAPSYDQAKKLQSAAKFYLDVVDHVKLLVGGERKIFVNHVLPHFARAGMSYYLAIYILSYDILTSRHIIYLATYSFYVTYILSPVLSLFVAFSMSIHLLLKTNAYSS